MVEKRVMAQEAVKAIDKMNMMDAQADAVHLVGPRPLPLHSGRATTSSRTFVLTSPQGTRFLVR